MDSTELMEAEFVSWDISSASSLMQQAINPILKKKKEKKTTHNPGLHLHDILLGSAADTLSC